VSRFPYLDQKDQAEGAPPFARIDLERASTLAKKDKLTKLKARRRLE
jgi:hypothetical protein